MSELKGFWSYVNDDDRAEQGRLCRLANDLKEQYQLLSGDSVTMFIAKDSIKWGDHWRDEINSNLASTAFFIPVLTPRYFTKPECLRELRIISQKASELGLKNIIRPLLYADVSALHEEKPANDLIRLIQALQWEDWQEARFLDVTSGEYRKRVFQLASRLFEANKLTEKSSPAIAPADTEVPKTSVDDSPGFVDKLAAFEENLPKLSETLKAINEDIVLIGRLNEEAATDIKRGKSQGKGFASTLLVTRRIAAQMAEPTDRIWSRSNEYASQLHKVDEGIRPIIERAPEEIRENPESRDSLCGFFKSVHILSESARVGLTSTQGMINSNELLEKMSRDLRPVVRRLRQGLTILLESSTVIDEWDRLIKSSGILCREEKEEKEARKGGGPQHIIDR